MPTVLETYMRVCTRKLDHDGEHLPYYKTPAKDEFGNKEIHHPRCLHVVPIPFEEEQPRYRIIFEIIDPRYPDAGWHEVGRETESLEDAISQYEGLIKLFQEGDDVRFPRIERCVLKWEKVEM